MALRIFSPEGEEVTTAWKKFHTVKLHNFCSSENIAEMTNVGIFERRSI
jgi:hypothetical protein